MIEAGIVQLILADAAINTLIAGQTYPVVVPANAAYPCMSYHTMTKPPQVSLDASALESKRLQIDFWSKNFLDVKNAQLALHALLDGFAGALPNGLQVIECSRSIESDFFESDSETFRAMSEYVIDYASGQ